MRAATLSVSVSARARGLRRVRFARAVPRPREDRTVTTYRKKPVEVEAVRVADLLYAASHDWKALPTWVADAYERADVIFARDDIRVRTLEGMMIGQRDDMLIRGVAGEIYPCKPDIFAATYEATGEQQP